MARTEEKKNSMLHRYIEAKKTSLGIDSGQWRSGKRPYLASECKSLEQCEHWRRQILREISNGVAAIQNKLLGEIKIRDLNDEINKKLREKRHWERQIIALGGPDYMRGARDVDEDGHQVLNSGGYKYFGAAKDLPGVRELFQKAARIRDETQKRSRAERYAGIDVDYYGFRDEEALGGKLLEVEAEATRRAKQQRLVVEMPVSIQDKEDERALEAFEAAAMFVPKRLTESDVAKQLLDARKKELLDRFAKDHQQEER